METTVPSLLSLWWYYLTSKISHGMEYYFFFKKQLLLFYYSWPKFSCVLPCPSGSCRSFPCVHASVSILSVSLFCSLASTCKWDHTVFVFLWLAYFTQHNNLQVHPCCRKGKDLRLSTSKNITTHFTVILALLWWSGTEPTISPRYACSLQTVASQGNV